MYMKRVTLTLALLFMLAFPALAQDATSEPTAESTPVVVIAPVEIPDDSTVIVIEAAEPTPIPAVDPDLQALLIAGVSMALLLVFSLFGRQLIDGAKNSVPPWALEPIFSAVDSVLSAAEANTKQTVSAADDAQIADLRKKYEEIKAELRNR